jgi:hypothetical protein
MALKRRLLGKDLCAITGTDFRLMLMPTYVKITFPRETGTLKRMTGKT